MSPFNTSLIEKAGSMFANCYSLKIVEFPFIIGNFLLSSSNMFSNCTNLNSIDMGNFHTFELNDLEYMFYNCKNLNYLDISHLTIDFDSNLNGIFKGIISNITVIVNKDINPILKDEILKLNTTLIETESDI